MSYTELHYKQPIGTLFEEYNITLADLESTKKLLKMIQNNNTDHEYTCRISQLLHTEIPELKKELQQSFLKDKKEIATKRFTKLLDFVKSTNDMNKILKILDLLTPDYIYKDSEDHLNGIYYDTDEIEKLYKQLNDND